MALRCLLVCSDEGAAQPISQTLADLGIEAEHVPVPRAMEQVASQVFHLLIVDWDSPDAAFLLNAARERKASERPMALAIVGADASVALALQAGANSILRKPVNANQAKDTLTTAHGLLRARHEAPQAQAAAAAAGGAAATAPGTTAGGTSPAETMLRAGEFLQSGATPSTQYVTESEIPKTVDQVAASEVNPLKDLEPMAAAVETQDTVHPPLPPGPDEPRGLSWYLKTRVAPAPPQPEATSEKAELLGFSEMPQHAQAAEEAGAPPAEVPGSDSAKTSEHEQRAEAALFAYITGEGIEEKEPKRLRSFGKIGLGVAFVAVLVAAFLIIPPSVWRPKAQSLFARSSHAVHNWLKPEPVTTTPAPASHENFGRAGDEYKLPVAENIPDATTDPTQIRVVPVIDPTAKQPNANNSGGQPAPVNTAPKDVPDTAPAPPAQPEQPQVLENQSPQSQASQAPPAGSASPAPAGQGEGGTGGAVQTPAQIAPTPVQPEMPAATTTAAPTPAVPQRNPHTMPAVTNSAIPSSLKSQMASTAPEASGNKPVEAALPSIEPVALPEDAARALISQVIEPVYPENANGQHGTVVLQLLIGRDGTIQDVKFQQGSLVFARAAIDAVRQWKFKPYTLNNRPVSVRTVLTLNFKPAS